MIVGLREKIVHHSVRESFGQLLRAALCETPTYAALGPIYEKDPANDILAPFIRSANEVGSNPDHFVGCLAPDHVMESAAQKRREYVEHWDNEAVPLEWCDVNDWTRAGLVLEVASRQGIQISGGGREHVRWKLRGTVTGRFGIEGGFNPLVIPREHRRMIVPRGPDRSIVVIDFKAMDLSSMLSLAPGLRERYGESADLHARTAELTGLSRDEAKRELFVYSYGGNSQYADRFRDKIPELKWIRGTVAIEASANARAVQRQSATAFKAGLSRALPHLVGSDIVPLFTVHDELTLDVLNDALPGVADVTKALEKGASERIGVPYTVGMTVGRNYGEAKS